MGPVAKLFRARLFGVMSVLLLLAAAGCKRRPATVPPPVALQAPPIAQTVGRCENINIAGTCSFTGVHCVDAVTGMPSMEQRPGPDGMVVYEIGYASPDGGSFPVSLWVRTTPPNRSVLEHFYGAHPQVPCAGVIIRPPCPPGVLIDVTVPPPPVGTVVRRP